MKFHPCKINLSIMSIAQRMLTRDKILNIWGGLAGGHIKSLGTDCDFILLNLTNVLLTNARETFSHCPYDKMSAGKFLDKYDPDRNKTPSPHASARAVDFAPKFIMHSGGVDLTRSERLDLLNGSFTNDKPKIEHCKMSFERCTDKRIKEVIQICFDNGIYWSGDNGPQVHDDAIGFLYIDTEILFEAPGDNEDYLADDLPEVHPDYFTHRYGKIKGAKACANQLNKFSEAYKDSFINNPTLDPEYAQRIQALPKVDKNIVGVDYEQLEKRALSSGFTPPKHVNFIMHSGGGGVGGSVLNANAEDRRFMVKGHQHTAANKPPAHIQIPVMAPGGFDYFTLETKGRPIKKYDTLKMLRDDIREPSEKEKAYAAKVAGKNIYKDAADEINKPAPILNMKDYDFPSKL